MVYEADLGLTESDLIPFNSTEPPGERVLVISPHPDDETLGCGGTIRRLIESGKHVKVIFLTSGDKADPSHTTSPLSTQEPHINNYSLLREKEAIKALKVLGVSEYEFIRFPDRELNANYKSVLERLLGIVEGYTPDTIYSPSMVELNPDHRTAASLSMEIQKVRTRYFTSVKNMPTIRIVLYEISTPLRPNVLVDITSVYNRKEEAVKKYTSQLKLKDYLRHITALNTIRSLTLNESGYVEAFWCIDEPLEEEDMVRWLSYQCGIKYTK